MNAFATRWLFSTNHKDIGTLYMIFGFFSCMIGTTVSVMLLLDGKVDVFYILSVLYLGTYFSIFCLMFGFSVDLREAVIFKGLEVVCFLCFKTQDILDHAHSIVQFVKQSIECLGTDFLVVYYQISCLILLIDSFTTWYWFTTITIVLLPWVAMKRHPSNFMLMHYLFGCMQPLLLVLRSAAFLRFGCCLGLGSLLIPVAACEGSDNGSGEEMEMGGDAPRSPSPTTAAEEFTHSLRMNTYNYQLAQIDTFYERRVAASCNPENITYAPMRVSPWKVDKPDVTPEERERADMIICSGNAIVTDEGLITDKGFVFFPGKPRGAGGTLTEEQFVYKTPNSSPRGGGPSSSALSHRT